MNITILSKMSLIRTFRTKNVFKQISLLRLVSNTTAANRTKPTINANEEIEEENRPIKYSTAPASKWQAKHSRMGVIDTRLWYEPYVIMISISAFLIYFLILREENDVDMDLNQSLYRRIPGLEEKALLALLKYNQERDLETKDIIARLEELQAAKHI